MQQDTIVCRFCLESKNTKRNPLIEPCECRGSIQYVHAYCLLRWRRIDPARNAQICLLCMTPYTIGLSGLVEQVPDDMAFSHLLLRFPILVCLVVNYGFLFHLLFFEQSQIILFFPAYQALFQLSYLVLFVKNWKVQNKVLYWQEWSHVSTTLLILAHIGCNGFLFTGHYGAIVPLNVVLGLYWQRHKNILRSLNNR